MRDAPNVDRAKLIPYMCMQSDVVVSYLFGSVARGQATAQSDVDIALLLDPGLDACAMVKRQLTLMMALETYCDREVQAVLLNTAPPLLAYQVLRDGLRLSARSESERIDFEVTAMKRYFDIQPMLAMQRRALFDRIKEIGLGRQERGDRRTLDAAERLSARLTMKHSPGPMNSR